MFNRLTLIFIISILLLLPIQAEAAIWVISPDGSGDAPTIMAAIEAAEFNDDVIELTDGVFSGIGNRDLNNNGKNILIKSQSGNPADCIIDLQGSVEDPHWGIKYAEDG